MKKFETLAELEQHIQKEGAPDYVELEGKVFTMDEYDMEGKEISYGNVKHQQKMVVSTSNRYSTSKFSDAVVTLSGADSFWQRNDMTYYE